MLLRGATPTRRSTTVMALVSVLSGAVSSAYLAAQVADPPTAHVLYEAGRFEHWSFPLTPDWTRLHGMLLNNGTHRGSVSAPIFAPYRPALANYAVEADIRVIEEGDSFGVVVRVDDDGRGYAAGVGRKGGQPFGGMLSGFEPGKDWHTYRIEVRGNVFTLYIDGTVKSSVTNNRLLSAGRVCLWSNRYQLEVRSFKVIALH
jgi:hypothetical protein